MKGFELMSSIRTPLRSTLPRDLPKDVAPGTTRPMDGRTLIFTGRIWLDYPRGAQEVIDLAIDSGWGFDDGLPARVRKSDGRVFVRILVGHERMYPLDTTDVIPATQFHLTWIAPPVESLNRSWDSGEMYVKTDVTNKWGTITSLSQVRKTIATDVLIEGHPPAVACQ